jgi:DNA-binding NtrC family response regulator
MSQYQYASTLTRPGQPLPRRERVLIVDDEVGIRMLLTRMLKGWGFGVWHVNSADEALQIMEAEPADILLSDVSMPERDGLWLAEQVHARWPRTAIIMSTAHQDPHTVQTSRKVGAVAYITKPFVAYVVQDALERVSAQRNARPR